MVREGMQDKVSNHWACFCKWPLFWMVLHWLWLQESPNLHSCIQKLETPSLDLQKLRDKVYIEFETLLGGTLTHLRKSNYIRLGKIGGFVSWAADLPENKQNQQKQTLLDKVCFPSGVGKGPCGGLACCVEKCTVPRSCQIYIYIYINPQNYTVHKWV